MAGTNGNTSAGPLFLDAASNFHLQSGSPAMDAGINTASLNSVHVVITNLPGNELGEASGPEGIAESQVRLLRMFARAVVDSLRAGTERGPKGPAMD